MTEDTELNGSKLDGEHASEFRVTDDGKLVKRDDEPADFEEDLTFDG